MKLPGPSGKTYLVQTSDVSAPQTPAAGGTVTPNVATGDTVAITMPAGNITVANPTNPVTGSRLVLMVTQDGVGSRTVTWGTKFPTGIVLSKAPKAMDALEFAYNGSTWTMMSNTRVA